MNKELTANAEEEKVGMDKEWTARGGEGKRMGTEHTA